MVLDSPFCPQGLQIISGNGHFRVSTKEGVLRDTRKANSRGADYVLDKVNRIFSMLGEEYGISLAHNFQLYVNASRWTAVSLENQCHVEVVGGDIVGMPEKSLALRAVACTEFRGLDLLPVIRNVYPRQGEQPNVSLNTVDLNKTNCRALSIKHQVDRPHFCGKATNCLPGDLVKDEEWKTMMTVIHTMVPGATAYVATESGAPSFSGIHCDQNQSRDKTPMEEPRRSYLIRLIGLTHVFAATLVALPNRSGIIPFEINDTVLAFLDWLFLYIRTHVSCVLDTDVVESFNRMKVGFSVLVLVVCGIL